MFFFGPTEPHSYRHCCTTRWHWTGLKKNAVRHRRDLNSRGQSPLAFKTNSLTTRTRCLQRIQLRRLYYPEKKSSTPTRFELARAEPSRFRIYLLNHSDTVSCPSSWAAPKHKEQNKPHSIQLAGQEDATRGEHRRQPPGEH